MMPKGQLIHRNLFTVGGGKPKIAASDCHTIGLDCTVQLCTKPVCHLTDCCMAAKLSGASSLECVLVNACKKNTPTPSSKWSKSECVMIVQ